MPSSVPENDIEWIVTPDGQLKMSWLKKIANYEESDAVTLTIKLVESENNSVEAVEESFRGTALEVKAPRLELGALYDVFVTDDDTGDKFGPFHVEACESIHFQQSYKLFEQNVNRTLLTQILTARAAPVTV